MSEKDKERLDQKSKSIKLTFKAHGIGSCDSFSHAARTKGSACSSAVSDPISRSMVPYARRLSITHHREQIKQDRQNNTGRSLVEKKKVGDGSKKTRGLSSRSHLPLRMIRMKCKGFLQNSFCLCSLLLLSFTRTILLQL